MMSIIISGRLSDLVRFPDKTHNSEHERTTISKSFGVVLLTVFKIPTLALSMNRVSLHGKATLVSDWRWAI